MKPLSSRAELTDVAVCFVRKGAPPSEALLAAAGAVHGRFASVDLDDAAWAPLIAELRVHRAPELLVWAGGKLVGRMEGAMTAEQVERFVSAALKRA